jgi:hypothetical protein
VLELCCYRVASNARYLFARAVRGETTKPGMIVANRNRSVVEILKLGIEFDHAVARPGLTSSSDWFLDHIYVPSLLDKALSPAILNDEYEVVFITGNPGDGKSAFLDNLIGGETNSGRSIMVKHDATEPADPEDRAASSSDDLIDFLDEISDSGFVPDLIGRNVLVVGINRGLLERAILSDGSPFHRYLIPAIEGDVRHLRAAIVDLNLRVFTPLPLEDDNDLFSSVLGRLVSSELWEDSGCNECTEKEVCPFFTNAVVLRGESERNRLKSLWAVEELRGARHSTMRDLLATLSYVLVGHRDMYHEADDVSNETLDPCGFVEREFLGDQAEPFSLYRRLYYNSVFRDSDIYEHGTEHFDGGFVGSSTYGYAPETLLRIHGDDPSIGTWSAEWELVEQRVVARPENYCDRLISSSYRLESEVGSRIKSTLLSFNEILADVEASHPSYSTTLEARRELIYLLVGIAKRRAFFHESDISLNSRTRYRYLEEFLRTAKILTEQDQDPDSQNFIDDLTQSVFPKAIMNSEGQHVADQSLWNLLIRWDTSDARVTVAASLDLDPSLRLVSVDSDYVESSPIAFEYFPLGLTDNRPSLLVTLDDFELLMRVSEGMNDRYGGFSRTKHLSNMKDRLRAQSSGRLVIQDRYTDDRQVEIRDGARITFT